MLAGRGVVEVSGPVALTKARRAERPGKQHRLESHFQADLRAQGRVTPWASTPTKDRIDQGLEFKCHIYVVLRSLGIVLPCIMHESRP